MVILERSALLVASMKISPSLSRKPFVARTTLSYTLPFAGEHFFNKRQRALVLALPQPEDGLLADLRVAIRACHLNQQGDSRAGRHLSEREDRLLLNFGLRVVGDGVVDGG